MNRKYSRVAALALFFYLSVSSAVMAGPRADRADRDIFAGPSERITRIVKKIKKIIRGITSEEDTPIPPVPKP